MSRRRRGSRRRRFYTALAVVIFGEAVFLSAIVLPGLLRSIQGGGNAQGSALTPRSVIQLVFASLMNPFNNSFINPIGLINNTRPVVLYINTVTNPPYIECGSWPVLYNASLMGYRVVLVILPDVRYQTTPADAYTVQRFIGYVNEVCGFNIGRANFMITTAYLSNSTIQTNIGPVQIVGLSTLLQDLFSLLNMSNVYFPIIIGVGANDTVAANNVVYGVNINSTSVEKLVRALGQ